MNMTANRGHFPAAWLVALTLPGSALAQPVPMAPAVPALPAPSTPFALAAALAPAWAEQDSAAERSREDAGRRDREARTYEQARAFLDQSKYDRAVERFTDVAAMKGARADAALYWKAWAQNKAGQRAEALTTLSALARDHAKSRYLAQGRQLEAEVRRDSGQPARPDAEGDDCRAGQSTTGARWAGLRAAPPSPRFTAPRRTSM